MIKTVRIASILIALLVIIIVALPVVLGANDGDAKTKKSLGVQSVVERFKKTRGNRAKKDADQIPPLVKEAKDFALYLNPPKPKVERVSRPVERQNVALPVVQPKARTARFNLIATCIHESNPALSVALIDEPGLDRRWVRQSDVVGHLIIKEIKEGSVIINDGTRTYPLTMAERPVETSLIVGDSVAGVSKRSTDYPPVLTNNIGLDKTALVKKQVPVAKRPAESIRNRQRSEPVIRSPEEQKIFDQFIKQLSDISIESGNEAAKKQGSEQAGEVIEKFFSEVESMRISGKEAQKLDDLGKELDSEKKDPNQPKVDKSPASSRRRPPVLR